MRTIPFQTVYESILRRHGLDPVGDRVTHDTARAIAQHVNKRIRQAWTYWDFPELSHTEERAYRTVWNATHQFFRGDDLFYIPSMTYYHVLDDATGDPPVGTVPATQGTTGPEGDWTVNSTYFEILSPVDTYVAYDPVCKTEMGQVLGVYATNPRLNGCAYQNGLNFRPSEKGIDVCCAPGPTVFIHYMLPEPKFTLVPWIGGKHYKPGDRVYQPTVGDCYRCRLATQSGGPPDPNYWFLESFPALLEDYVVPGAYADCLKETPIDGGDVQTKALGAAAAESEATAAIQSAIDALIAQGQKHYWLKPYPYAGVCGSQPWTGTTVTTLTDLCEEDWVTLPLQSGIGTPPRRGSLWFTGSSNPTGTSPTPSLLLPQDMYLNTVTGDVFQFDGTTMAWRVA
jgi:hypothetical protein